MIKEQTATRVTITVLASLLVALITGAVSYSLNRAACLDTDLRVHEKLVGHPGIVERVDSMRADISDIKRDIKSLLERSNP